MIINEERFAAAIAYRHGSKIDYMYFDDGGELFEAQVPPHDEARYYVHDAGTSEWLDAKTAFYLRSKTLRTPMGFGLAAYTTEAAAKAAAVEYPGEFLRYSDLVK